MSFLVFAILSSTINHLLFKAFARFNIDLLTAIVVNYAVCVVIGLSSSMGTGINVSMFSQSWYPYSILQGAALVICFFLIGRTTNVHGVAIASLATRLSVAIPTITAFMIYGDAVTLTKISGILMAFFVLYISCAGSGDGSVTVNVMQLLPATLFITFGLHSILVKFVQIHYLGDTSYHAYVMFSFLSAFIISGLALMIRLIRKNQRVDWKSVIPGMVLGCANYGAVYFLIRVLSVPGWESSTVFPTISIAILIFSSFGAWALFKEKLRPGMVGALILGIGSIVLINL